MCSAIAQSRMLAFDAVTAPVFLIVTHALFLFVFAPAARAAIYRAERQAWHLKQLLR